MLIQVFIKNKLNSIILFFLKLWTLFIQICKNEMNYIIIICCSGKLIQQNKIDVL